MTVSPNVMHISSDIFLPRRRLKSFFLEPHHVRFIIHARMMPILRITHTARGYDIGVEIGREVLRCATWQTQGGCSLAQLWWRILTSEESARARAPGEVMICRGKIIFCEYLARSAMADARGRIG